MDIKHNQSTKQELLCCRACLSTECRLFYIHQYKLSEAFTRISGTTVLKDQLPQYLCAQCCTLLHKCISFRDMCLQTEQYLKLELQKGELNTDCIRRFHHSSHWLSLSLSGTLVIDCATYPPTGIKAGPYDVRARDEPTVDIGIKCEENLDIDEAYLDETYIDSSDADDVDSDRKDILEGNLDETHADCRDTDDVDNDRKDIVEGNLDETHTDFRDTDDVDNDRKDIDEANLHEIHTHFRDTDDVDNNKEDIDEANLDEIHTDSRDTDDVDNDKKDIDDAYINEFYIDSTDTDDVDNSRNDIDEDYVDESHTDSTDTDVLDNSSKSGSKIMNKKNKIKIKDIHNVEDKLSVNKVKAVKTNKRNTTVGKKKIGTQNIEMHLNSDKVNDVVDNDEKIRDLHAATIDKANEADGLSIDDSDGQMAIVDVDSIVQIFKNKTDNSNDISDKNELDSKRENVLKPGRLRKERKRKYRNPANDYMPTFDFSKFESEYGVKIDILSKQEQLEEIAARKQSLNYTASQYKCEDCMWGFNTEAVYSNHRRWHSPSAGEHVCDVCSRRFRRASRCHAHRDGHRLKFTCGKCGFVCRTRSGARAHHAAHNGKMFDCQHCGRSFSKMSTYLGHVRQTHPTMNVACDACGETFVSQKGLKMHKNFTHSQSAKPQQFNCTTCSAKFLSLDALNRHTDSGEHSGCACEQCGESCASETALQAHVEARHPPGSHRCEECDATFSNSAAYDIHHRRKHLNERYSARGRVARKPLPGKRVRTREQFMCEQCGHIAPNETLLRYHQNSHLAVKPFPCSHCEKTFVTKAARKVHERTHTGEKPYKCSLCPMAFSRQGNYERHRKSIHLGIHANVACHLCARVFTTKTGMQLHVNSVHKGQPWPRSKRRQKAGK